jgi:hypothetical protein
MSRSMAAARPISICFLISRRRCSASLISRLLGSAELSLQLDQLTFELNYIAGISAPRLTSAFHRFNLLLHESDLLEE